MRFSLLHRIDGAWIIYVHSWVMTWDKYLLKGVNETNNGINCGYSGI